MARPLDAPAAFVLLFSALTMVAADTMPIEGTWRLDERASKNVPDSMKGIDLKISIRGRELVTERFFEDAPVGSPLSVSLNGQPVERELVKGQRGTIQASWKAGGKLLEQIVKMRQANLIAITQTTLVSISADGKIMTRIQTTASGNDTSERILIYRRK